MPDIKSVLATYEKTISANDQAGVTSRMFLNNIAKQTNANNTSRMTLQSSRVITVAHRRRARQADSEGAAPQQYPSLSSRIQTSTKLKTPTDVTITTCSMEDDDSDAGAWNVSNNDPFGDEASCNVDDDGFQLFSRTNEDSWQGSFNSFNGSSFASNPRHDVQRKATSTPNVRHSSTRSTRSRDNNQNEDDGFTVIFQTHEEEASVTRNIYNDGFASKEKPFNSALSKLYATAPAPHRSPKESQLAKANSSSVTKDTVKSPSGHSLRRASVAGAVRTVTPAQPAADDNHTSRGSRTGRRASVGVDVVPEAPAASGIRRSPARTKSSDGEALVSSVTRRSPARTKSSDRIGASRARSRSRTRQPSASTDPSPSPCRASASPMTSEPSQRTRTASLKEDSARYSSDASRRMRTIRSKDVTTSGSSPRHSSMAVPSADASSRLTRTTALTEATGCSTSPRHPSASSTSSARRPGTTISTPGTSHLIRKSRGSATSTSTTPVASRGMSDIERLCSSSSSSQTKKSTTSKPIAGGASRVRTSRDKQKSDEDTFAKMLNHSQNFDWDN